MAAKLIVFISAQILLAQCAFSQLAFGGIRPSTTTAVSGTSVVDNTVIVNNNAGIGASWINDGLINSGLGLANTGVVGSGIGLANTGLSTAGIIRSDIGLANTGLLGNAIVPPVNTDYLTLASFSMGDVFPVTSYSAMIPTGLTVVSENVIEGPIAIAGQLPFLSAVAFEGTLATEGAGTAACGCGSSGNIGIISESYGPIAPPALGGLGVGSGIGVGAGLGPKGGVWY